MRIKDIFKDSIRYVKHIYLLIIGFLWILYFIYIRLLMERKSYDLEQLNINWKHMCFQLGFLILHLIIIVLMYYRIRNQDIDANNQTKLMIKIQSLWNFLFIEPLIYLRDLIAPHIPYVGFFYTKFINIIIKFNINPTKFLVITFYAIPRIFVSLIFFIELFFHQRIYYFIPSLFLLIIPLLWRIFVNLFTDFGKRGLQDIQEYIHVIPIGDKLPNGWFKNYSFETKEHYIYTEELIQGYVEGWRTCMLIYGYGENFLKLWQNILSSFITVICSSFYATGILAKLIYIIN